MKLEIHRLILAVLTGMLAVAAPSTASADLAVANGNFEDTTGRTDLSNGWYGGVAPGWNGPSQDYSAGTVEGNIVANMQWASVTPPGAIEPLYQDIGVLDTTSTITLTFDHGDFGGNPPPQRGHLLRGLV